MIQGGALRVEEEERGVGKFFNAAEMMGAEGGRGAQVDLTSGYFGLYHTYKKAVLEGKAPYRIVAASPEVSRSSQLARVDMLTIPPYVSYNQANGFFGSAGVSRLIPEGYTLLESQFHRDLVRRGRDWEAGTDGSGQGVELNEWKREGWTYHAKGQSAPERSGTRSRD
jgi:CDP-diacylglycerol--glycerol-3-phosphate 3-phosphatidyltransferase